MWLSLDSLVASTERANLFDGSPVSAGYSIPQEIDDQTRLFPKIHRCLCDFLTDAHAGLRSIAPQAPVKEKNKRSSICFGERLSSTVRGAWGIMPKSVQGSALDAGGT